MPLHTFTLYLPSTRPTPSELHGFSSAEHPLLPHSPGSDRLISLYPPAQYKTIDGAPGINDGAGFSKQIYDKYNEIIHGGA